MSKIKTKKTQDDVNDVALEFLLLTLGIFYTFFLVFLLLCLNKLMLTGLFGQCMSKRD